MHRCDGEHKPPDDSEACYCVQPVLERLSRLKQGLCHPVDDHERWYQLGSDDQFIDRIKPWVTHQCSPRCFNQDGSLKLELDGLMGTNGQPPHANGAVSLPPLDPRPELRRAVMREAMTLIAADFERDTQAAKEALAKRKALVDELIVGEPLDPFADPFEQWKHSVPRAEVEPEPESRPGPGPEPESPKAKGLNLLKEFKMKLGTDDGGILRWMHEDHGFVLRLKDTLATLPAEYFDKADWEPMISDVLKEASEIIGHQDWPNELGFEEFDVFSKDVLSSGVQADHAAGVLISSMGDFMAQHKQRKKHLRKCTGEVTEKLDVVKSKLQKLDDMEELNRTIDDYELADEGGDERLELAPKLRALLESFDYTDGLDDLDGLLIAYEDFQDGSAATAGRIDEELLAARIDLLRVLAKLAVSVKDRVEIMEKMLPEVEEKAKDIQMKADHLCALCEAKTETINELPVSGDTRQWVLVLDATKKATQHVAKCAELMLVKHPQSIANNIRKDIEQTQDTGREHDTMHFDTYCAAWSKTLEDETFVKAEKGHIDARIGKVTSDFISARRGK
jgi:hypothetical protein